MGMMPERPGDWEPCPTRADKRDIASDFGRAATTYEQASRLQRMMGMRMLERLSVERASPLRILDLGCGTGWFSRALARRYPDAVIVGADLAEGMVSRARAGGGAAFLAADAEALPFVSGGFDLVFSNLMIQWCSEPEQVLSECRRLLRPGGWLALSTLLEGTLSELRQAWAVADPGRPHVNEFVPETCWRTTVTGVLPGADCVAETLRLPYDSPMALNRELKGLGATFKGDGRRRSLTAPGRFRAMVRAYPVADGDGVLASYRASWVYWSAR
jgi:malonyl-CoA O-methyltransferase